MEPHPAVGVLTCSEGLQTCIDAPVISREKKSHLRHAGGGGCLALGVSSLSK